MLEIALAAMPNQSFTVQADNQVYEITIKETSGTMSATISIDDVEILSNSRIVGGTPLIPFQYLESGNFVLLTADDDLPYYTEFGITQSLIYISVDEVEAFRAGA